MPQQHGARRAFTTLLATAALLVAGAGLTASPAQAATTFTWTGDGSTGNWSDPANWGGTAPSGSVTLDFPSGPAHVTTTDDLAGLDVQSIFVEGSGYTLSGDDISPSHITASGSGPVTISNNIPLSADLIVSTQSGDTVSLAGVISGAHGFVGSGSGTVVFTGTGANTFVGDINANGTSVVELDKPAGTAASAGGVTAGSDFTSGTVKWLASDQVSDTATIGAQGSSTLDLNGFNDSVGSVIMNSGTLRTGAGTLTVDGGIYNNNTSGEIDGNLHLTSSSHTVGTAFFNNVLTINAHLTGDGAIDKTGADGSVVTLNDACGYTGPLTIDGGAVSAPNGYGGTVTDNAGNSSISSCASYQSTSPPTISGTFAVGQVLSGDPGTFSSSPSTYDYQWLRCSSTQLSSCSAIAGATSSQYQLGVVDQGSYLALQVIADGDLGQSAPADSEVGGPVVPAADAPAAHTGGSYGVSGAGATLLGIVDGNGKDTSYWFDYGTDTGYGASTSSGTDTGGSNAFSVMQDVTGLEAGTTYHYRLVAQNSDGTSYGSDQNFRTRGAVVTLQAPTGDDGHHITLNGTVNDQGNAASYTFTVTGTGYSQSASGTLPASGSDQSASGQFSGLQPDTPYDETLSVTTSDGTVSATGSFTTGSYAGIANDDRAYATPETGLTGSVSQSNTGATAESGEGAHGGQPASHSLWFHWTAPTPASTPYWMKLSLSGAGVDPVMSLYGADRPLENDDALSSDSAIEFRAGTGASYDIAVDTKGATGPLTLSWDELTAPSGCSRSCPPVTGSFGIKDNTPYALEIASDYLTGFTPTSPSTGQVGPFSYTWKGNALSAPMALGSDECLRGTVRVDCTYDWWNTFAVTRTGDPTMVLGSAASMTYSYSATRDRITTVRPDHLLPLQLRTTAGSYATTYTVASKISSAQLGSALAPMHWRTIGNASAMGGSYDQMATAGAWASYSFTGKTATIYTVKGPEFGQAQLFLDGTLVRTQDLSASLHQYAVPVQITATAVGSHKLKVVVVGSKGAHGTGTAVAVDGLKLDANPVQTSPAFVEAWGKQVVGSPMHTDAPGSADRGASVTVPSDANTFTYWYVQCPSCGKMSVNGTVVDTYAATVGLTHRAITFTGHLRNTLTIVVLGSHSAASTGNMIMLGSFSL